MFEAEGSVRESQLEKGMAIKTIDRAFLQGQNSAHGIQMNFYPNPDGPAKKALKEGISSQQKKLNDKLW